MQTKNLTNIEKIRAFRFYYGAQAANTVFVLLTWFGVVMPLFLNALGLSNTQIGFILAIPFLCSPLSLLVSRGVLRWGVKRTFLWSLGLRTFITAGLCVAPVVLLWTGVPVVFVWVLVICVGFSIFRAVGETGFMSWARELVPSHLRGKTDAVNAIVSGLVSVATLLLASLFLQYVAGLRGYSLLFLLSLLFGVVSLVVFAMMPGGLPVQVEVCSRSLMRDCLQVLKDQNFRYYEFGLGLFTLASSTFAFLPLFIKGPIGLEADKVLLLSACFWVGLLASSYLWGWSADRFGSKPVLLTGLLLVMLVPFGLFLMPHASIWSLRMAIVTYVFYGVAIQGLNAGTSRYFYVSAIPAASSNSAYYSIHYTWNGLLAALGPLLAGFLLDLFHGLSSGWRFIRVDSFTPLFALSLLLFLASFHWFGRLRKDGPMRPSEFMSLFIQGNPIMAFNSMIRYRFASDEAVRLSTTRRMGDAENPMSVAELLEAITDPSFSVRYEAVVAMARMPPQPQLTQALIAILDSKEPDLSVTAGWALGRIGDPQAVPALRRALTSGYALLRSRSARSLAALGDAPSVPVLLDLFKSEKHDGIRVAYASALGVFRVSQALDDLLLLLYRLPDENLRSDVALAIMRIMGGEHHFYRLWRSTRSDFGTGAAEAISMLRKYISRDPAIGEVLDAAEQAMSSQDISSGAAILERLIRKLPLERLEPNQRKVLENCAGCLTTAGQASRDCVLLALSGLHIALIMLRRQRELEKTDDKHRVDE